tara:strand:+ start:2985 stop:6923 length:3939 start_codon:yes stop_codon:yes gene_type:complete
VAASIEQKLDFLLKKIGYVASKTGIAEDSTLSGTKKAPFGEAIPSPLVVPANSVWAQANQIPATPPGATTPYVRVYLSGTSGHRMTVDNTVSDNRTFIARSTYNNNSSSILGDWIDTSFSADYIIEVYKGDPNSGGVKLSAAGSGSNDTWFFDYSSGVLNFNGTVVPSGITSTNIYIVGYRYIGIKGVATPGGSASFTDVSTGGLSVTGIATIFNTTDNTLGNENTGSVQLDGGMGIAKNLTVKQNLHVGGYAEFVGVATFKGGTINLGDADTDDINVAGEFVSDLVPDVDDTYSLGTASKQWKNLFINGHAELDNTVISGVSTFSSPLDINADVDIDGHTELDNVNIVGVTTFQSNAFFGDADYIQMGDAQDLKIGHVGSYSVILDQGAGNLSIGGDGFVDIMNTALDEYKARFTTNGSVELYFDNVNKFETTGYGATVFGTLQSQQLNVTGVSTYAGDADFNGHVDIDGHTELDNVNVSGVTTTGGLLDINAGGQANTFKVEDLTDNRVVIAGTGGELEDDANLTFNGSTLSVGVDLDVTGDLDVDGHTELDNVNISGVTTVAGNIDANGDLDVDGHTNLDNLSVTGVTTFTGTLTASGSLNLSGDLDVDRHTNLDNVSVSGVSTFTGAIDANGDLDVDGHTNLDNVNVSGVTTTAGLLDINAGGQANTFKVEDLTDNRVVIAGTGGELEDDANLTFNGSILAVGADLDVDGHTNLDNISVAGVSTFTGAIDANGNLDVDGTTELDVLNVAETATFSANIDANGDLDVDGHTELDNVNISGIATATAFHTGAEGSAIRVTSNTISGPAEMFIDPAGVGDNTGALRIKGDLFVDGTQTVINSTTIELGDFIVGIATTATTDSLADGAGIKIGPDNTFLYDHSNTSLKSSENLNLTSGKTYKIDGTDVLSATTLGSGVVNSSLTSLGTLLGLTVSGQTSLNTLGVTGVSTFTGAIDANGDLDVDGHTNLDNVSIAGVTTTAGLLDINAGGRANTFIVEDLTDNRVVLVGTGGELEDDANLTFNGSTLTVGVDLDIDGHTNLDNVSVAGVTTFTGVIEASAGENKIPSLYANLAALPSASTYHGMFAHVHSTGRAYFAHAGNWLELVNKSVAGNVGTGTEGYNVGIITATGIDLNGDLDVDGHTNLDNVSVAGVTTFTGKIVGAATDNVIPFLYSTMGDLPNAGTYHGAFAHVHNQGKGFFAHGGAWYELVNKEQNGTVGTGTERYNVGQIDSTSSNVSGVSTSATLNVGVGGTVLNASVNNSRVGINSTTPAYSLDVIGDINSSTDIKVNGVSIVSQGASLDDVVALAIALG